MRSTRADVAAWTAMATHRSASSGPASAASRSNGLGFATGDAGRIRFTSAVLPAYLRRARNVEELLPWLYLKGVNA
jgi:hypothetical protein